MKTKTLRTIQEYLQPEIGRKIRIFSLGRKNNILISIYKKKECSVASFFGGTTSNGGEFSSYSSRCSSP